jgi:hypothetical protein
MCYVNCASFDRKVVVFHLKAKLLIAYGLIQQFHEPDEAN